MGPPGRVLAGFSQRDRLPTSSSTAFMMPFTAQEEYVLLPLVTLGTLLSRISPSRASYRLIGHQLPVEEMLPAFAASVGRSSWRMHIALGLTTFEFGTVSTVLNPLPKPYP